MTKKLLASFVLTIIFAMQVCAQGRTVSGKVADKKGEAIPGANIVVKGNTAIATVSGDNGTYSLANVPDNATLVVTATTFSDIEIVIGTEIIINVTMSEENTMSTVVVEGAIGIKREKKELGYSTTTIAGDAIVQGAALTGAAGLQGKVAGLQISQTSSGVNAQTRITLRGNRSILGNNQALIVIDGSQSTQAAFNLLNPNDIASTTILKGASAAALYGSDASNGVVLVTTKKGVAGTTRVTFSSTFQVERVSFLPEFQDKFGNGTAARNSEYNGGENQSFGPAYDGSIRATGGESTTPMTLEDGSIAYLPYSAVKDQKRSIWNTGTVLQNDISVSGGSGNTVFYLSANDLVEKGVVDRDTRRRTGLRLNAETKAGKLTIGFNAGFNSSLIDITTSNLYDNILNTAAHIPIASYRNWQNFRNDDGTLNLANPDNYYNQYTPNPWFELDNERRTTRTNNFTGNATANYEVSDWMKATYRISLTNTNSFTKSTQGKYTYRDYRTTQVTNFPGNVAGSVEDNVSYNTRISQDAYLTFNKKFNSSFKSTLILGSTINDISAQNTRVASTSIVVPGLYNVINRFGEPLVEAGANTISLTRNIGLYATLNLGFKDYLFVNLTARNEWTSLLDQGKNSFFYPAADVSFVVSNAIPALKESKVLSFAKVTASIAKAGNINVGPYSTKSVYNVASSTPTATIGGVVSGFPYGGLTAYTVGNQLVAPELTPEITTQYEVGAELAFYDRINLEVALYKSETVNQTLPISISPASGYRQLLTNVGKMESNGVEVTLRGDVIKSKSGLVWGVSTNYSYRDNKVTELFGEVTSLSVRTGNDPAFSNSNGGVFAVVGEQYPNLQVKSYLRDAATGRVIVDALTGYPKAASALVNAGQTNPKHTIGLGTTLSYKGFALGVTAEYRGGNVFYHDIANNLVNTGTGAITTIYNRERFVFPNSSFQSGTATDGTPIYTPNTSVTVADGAYNFWDKQYRNFGENFVTSGAFWKLREARISYTIPTSILQEASKYIKGVTVSFVGRNLLIFLPKTNQFSDPEAGTSTGNATGASTSLNTPVTRTYGFNLSVTL